MTGTPIFTSASMVAAWVTPPSSLTDSAPPSWTSRPALRLASSTPSWKVMKGMSDTTRARLRPRITARVW